MNGERLGQGRENVKQFPRDNPEVCKTIEQKVRVELGLARDEVAVWRVPVRPRGRAAVCSANPPRRNSIEGDGCERCRVVGLRLA